MDGYALVVAKLSALNGQSETEEENKH